MPGSRGEPTPIIEDDCFVAGRIERLPEIERLTYNEKGKENENDGNK
jgi:hypothetical protein